MKKNLILVGIAFLLLGVVLVFFLGIQSQNSKKSNVSQQLDQSNQAAESKPLDVATDSAKQKSTDAREIIVDGSNFKFSPDKITIKKDEKIRIVFKNTQGVHDFKVDELKIATKVIRAKEEDWVEFFADKIGTFEFYCSVGSHKEMGMKGTLIVE